MALVSEVVKIPPLEILTQLLSPEALKTYEVYYQQHEELSRRWNESFSMVIMFDIMDLEEEMQELYVREVNMKDVKVS